MAVQLSRGRVGVITIDSSLLACTAHSRGENDSWFSRIGHDGPPTKDAHQRAVAHAVIARRYNNPASAKLTYRPRPMMT